jgi:hypothetical protein
LTDRVCCFFGKNVRALSRVALEVAFLARRFGRIFCELHPLNSLSACRNPPHPAADVEKIDQR